ERHNPDAVLCTQFLPAEVFAFLRERNRVRVPVSCVITDYSIHPIWIYRGIDRYYVASAFVQDQIIDTGVVPRERVEVTGVTLDSRVAIPIQTSKARKELGLDTDPARQTILIMGGGFG